MKDFGFEAGATCVKTITEVRFTCPNCGVRQGIYDITDYEVKLLFDGELELECGDCDVLVHLFFEDEL